MQSKLQTFNKGETRQIWQAGIFAAGHRPRMENTVMTRTAFAVAAVVTAGALGAGTVLLKGQAQQVAPARQSYQRTSGVSGGLIGVGSDTMNNRMTLWAETFGSV
jgi:ABC-type phosphate transport system substrate-binding protein